MPVGLKVSLYLCGRCNIDNIRHIGREFGEEGNGHGFSDPPADVLDQLGVLSARQTHSAFAHAVRTREVEFERVRPGVGGHLGQGLPVLAAVRTHDARDDDVRGEVGLHFSDAPERKEAMTFSK